MRHTLLANLLDAAADNARYTERIMLFEVGPVFWQGDETLPDEVSHLGIVMTGPRYSPSWIAAPEQMMDFYDIRGVIERLEGGLHLADTTLEPSQQASYYPGRSADWYAGGSLLGTFGELHPTVAQRYRFESPVLLAEIDLQALASVLPSRYRVQPLLTTPPVLEDLALVVDDATTAAEVEAVLRRAGGDLLKQVRLFDVYRGSNIPAGHKSLAYALTYQSDEDTLTDKDVTRLRNKIIAAAGKQLGATLRA